MYSLLTFNIEHVIVVSSMNFVKIMILIELGIKTLLIKIKILCFMELSSNLCFTLEHGNL